MQRCGKSSRDRCGATARVLIKKTWLDHCDRTRGNNSLRKRLKGCVGKKGIVAVIGGRYVLFEEKIRPFSFDML